MSAQQDNTLISGLPRNEGFGLFELNNVPQINIEITGNIHSGKSRLLAKIAKLIEEEIGYPYTVISGDGDFVSVYMRENGHAPKEYNNTTLCEHGTGQFKPVKITLIDDNRPYREYVKQPHAHQYTLF
jgi:hypothetical protein